MGIFNDVVYSFDVKISSSSVGVGGGESEVVEEGYGLKVVSWVDAKVLESALLEEVFDGGGESGGVR